MIAVLLNAWITKSSLEEKKQIPKADKKYLILLIVLTLLNVISAFLYLPEFTINGQSINLSALCTIISPISFVLILVVVARWDKNSIKRYSEHYEKLNIQLDMLKNILENFRYGCFKNWYSIAKINHLIGSFESYIQEEENRNAKLINLGEILILPTIGFVAGVIAERSSIEFTLSLGIFALLFIICAYSVCLLFKSIVNAIFKSSSISEMKYLLSLLKDLLVRDFNVE